MKRFDNKMLQQTAKWSQIIPLWKLLISTHRGQHVPARMAACWSAPEAACCRTRISFLTVSTPDSSLSLTYQSDICICVMWPNKILFTCITNDVMLDREKHVWGNIRGNRKWKIRGNTRQNIRENRKRVHKTKHKREQKEGTQDKT